MAKLHIILHFACFDLSFTWNSLICLFCCAKCFTFDLHTVKELPKTKTKKPIKTHFCTTLSLLYSPTHSNRTLPRSGRTSSPGAARPCASSPPIRPLRGRAARRRPASYWSWAPRRTRRPPSRWPSTRTTRPKSPNGRWLSTSRARTAARNRSAAVWLRWVFFFWFVLTLIMHKGCWWVSWIGKPL